MLQLLSFEYFIDRDFSNGDVSVVLSKAARCCDVTAKQFESIRPWLRSLHLSEYVDTFQTHGFTTLERLHNLWDVELTSVPPDFFALFWWNILRLHSWIN